LLLVVNSAFASTLSGEWPVFQGSSFHCGLAGEMVPPLKVMWEVNLRSAVYSSPVIRDGRIYVATERGELTCLSAAGNAIWTAGLQGKIYASTPCVGEAAVYIGAVRGRGLKTGAVYALQTADGKAIWTFTPPGDVYSSPLIVDSLLVVGCDDGNVYGLNRDDGTVAWKFRTQGKVHDNAAATDGTRIFIGSYDGFMYALSAKNGKEIWRFRTRKRLNTAAALADGRVFFGAEDGRLYSLSADDAALEWFFEAGAAIVATPVVSSDRIFVGSSDGTVRALTRQGKLVWSFKAGRHLVSSPVLAGRHLYTGSIDTLGVLDQSLYALDAQTGSVVWERELKGPLFASPAVGGGLMIVATRKGYVFAFRGRAGKE